MKTKRARLCKENNEVYGSCLTMIVHDDFILLLIKQFFGSTCSVAHTGVMVEKLVGTHKTAPSLMAFYSSGEQTVSTETIRW